MLVPFLYIILFIFLGLILFFGLRRIKKQIINPEYYLKQWLKLLEYLKSRKLWYKAIIDADKLLDEALSRANYKGQSVGEKLVAAQKDLKDNPDVWYAHKLSNKLKEKNVTKVSKSEVFKALNGIKQTLVDLKLLKPRNKNNE